MDYGIELVNDKPQPTPHHVGHRHRLRQRFLNGGGAALPDYELIEVILFAANPRADVKPLAKALIEHFGGLQQVLSAPPEELASVSGLKDAGVVALKAAHEAGLRLVRASATERPVMSSWSAVIDYCRASMAYETAEQFRLLFLNRKNRIIADEVQQRGTVDHTPVYPREVVKRALEIGASAIILVHNHPSGDPTPSQADIDMTKEIQEAARSLGIAIHDHIIIAGDEHASLKGLGLM